MKDYMKKHEKYIKRLMSEGNKDPAEILSYHRQKIKHMQHERLVHLVVMVLAILVFLFSFTLFYITGTIPAALLTIILLVLALFYIRHYYFLENTIQRWYSLADRLEERVNGIGIPDE